jgi:hypothetical protein
MRSPVLSVALLLVVAGLAVADEEKKLVLEAPKEWKAEPAKGGGFGPKVAYKLEAAEGDKEQATASLFHFGGGGGSWDDNLKRWLGQFTLANGDAMPKEKAKVEEIEANGIKIKLAEITGTYTAPSFGGPKNDPKAGWKLLAAMVEGPDGPSFVRIVGPEKTVEKHRADFMKWLKSAKAEKK